MCRKRRKDEEAETGRGEDWKENGNVSGVVEAGQIGKRRKDRWREKGKGGEKQKWRGRRGEGEEWRGSGESIKVRRKRSGRQIWRLTGGLEGAGVKLFVPCWLSWGQRRRRDKSGGNEKEEVGGRGKKEGSGEVSLERRK